MKCVDCGSTLGLAHPSVAIRISPSGSAGICAACVVRYGPSVALDLRLDEAINALLDPRAATTQQRRQG